MLNTSPMPIRAVQRDEPPYDRKNNGIPVIGIMPIAMPILMKTWNAILANTPPVYQIR